MFLTSRTCVFEQNTTQSIILRYNRNVHLRLGIIHLYGTCETREGAFVVLEYLTRSVFQICCTASYGDPARADKSLLSSTYK